MFIPDGEGDAAPVPPTTGAFSFLSQPGDPTCSGQRANANAIGACLTIKYSAIPSTAMVYGAGGAMVPAGGWASMIYQHPDQGWGKSPGFAMPAGATKVSFYAKGALGGEVVSFGGPGLGYGGTPTAASPCADSVTSVSIKETLTTTWTQYTIPIIGSSYAGGVLEAFYFSVANADQTAAPGADAGAADSGAGTADGGTDAGHSGGVQLSFYIDDIRWE